MSSIRVGIIGSGRHGSRYAHHIVHDVPGLHLTAISRRSAQGSAQAASWCCKWYRDWRDLVTDRNVDAVISVVPPTLNLEIARICAVAGKPLLVEKPLATTATDAETIVDLYADSNLSLTTGQTLRYNPVIRRLREHLPAIGCLYSFSANQRLEPSTLGWHADPGQSGAGVSMHTAVHVFDALHFITGQDVRRVMALSRRHQSGAVEDLVLVLAEMEGGVVGTIDCSRIGNARSGRFEFIGSDGHLCGDQVHGTLEVVRGREVTALDRGMQGNTIIPLLLDWQAFLCGQGPNPVSGEEGLAAVRLCEACLVSAASESWAALR